MEPLFTKASLESWLFLFMQPDPKKTRQPIPVSVVTYRVLRPDKEEIRRILGRDLVEAERLGKKR